MAPFGAILSAFRRNFVLLVVSAYDFIEYRFVGGAKFVVGDFGWGYPFYIVVF